LEAIEGKIAGYDSIVNKRPFIKRWSYFNQFPQLPMWFLSYGHMAAKARFLHKIKTVYEYKIIKQCPLCGGVKFFLVANQERHGLPISVVICENCSLLFNNPRLNQDAMFDHLKTDARGLERGQRSDIHDFMFSLQREKGPRIMEFLSFQPGSLKNIKSVADIGCGEGGTLSYLKEFFEKVVGFELNEEAVNWGRREKGLDIKCASYREKDPNQSFDLVVYEQVLEHVLDLNEELRFLSASQKIGDCVYIGLPGIFDFPDHYDHNFISYLEYQHVHHFTLYTLEMELAKYHYKLLKGNEIIQALFERVAEEEEIILKSSKNTYKDILAFIRAEEQVFSKKRKPLKAYILYLIFWILFQLTTAAKKIFSRSSTK